MKRRDAEPAHDQVGGKQPGVYLIIDRWLVLPNSVEGADVSLWPSSGLKASHAFLAHLLQPEADLPSVVILDEPELGLNPDAIDVIAGLLQSVATHTQAILATQSMSFVDYFRPEHVVVVDRIERESKFRRLDAEPLKVWLDEYSLSELWEKNVIGGRPGDDNDGCYFTTRIDLYQWPALAIYCCQAASLVVIG